MGTFRGGKSLDPGDFAMGGAIQGCWAASNWGNCVEMAMGVGINESSQGVSKKAGHSVHRTEYTPAKLGREFRGRSRIGRRGITSGRR